MPTATQSAISRAAAAMGRSRSKAKTTAARRNGRLGGVCRQWWLVLSGAGDQGTWQAVLTTHRGIACRITREQECGARWARAYEMLHACADGLVALQEYRGNGLFSVSRGLLLNAGVPARDIPA